MKKSLTAAALALVLCSSCLGPDRLYNSIKNWNAGLSERDWLNEVVFLGLVIIPVYPLALFGDIVILNPLEYWTGKPMLNDTGAFPGFTRKD
jgi:hypothetical protein